MGPPLTVYCLRSSSSSSSSYHSISAGDFPLQAIQRAASLALATCCLWFPIPQPSGVSSFSTRECSVAANEEFVSIVGLQRCPEQGRSWRPAVKRGGVLDAAAWKK